MAALYDSLQPVLLRYLRSQDPSAAEDLTSETWLAVARGLGRFEGNQAEFRAWIFAIARRRLVDHRRKVARRRTDPTPDTVFATVSAGADPADLVTTQIAVEEAINRLRALLSADQAEVLVLRVVGGLTVEDVARIMGKRVGAIRALQHRALRRLSSQAHEEFLLEA